MSRSRTVAVIVIVVAFVALAAFALLARAYRPGNDGVRVPDSSLGLVTPQLAQPIAVSSPLAVAATVAGATQDRTGAARSNANGPTPPSNPSPGDAAPLAACELGLPVPRERAGLANLVGLVPLFGPFSPEAFAMVPAFEPAFPLFGPMIIAGGAQLDAHASEFNALVSAARPFEQAAFDALAPVYGPHRAQFLAAEAAAAATLRPGVGAFAAAPGATCLPAALALLF